MRVWLITVGEPLPGLSGGARLWRTGLLANELARRGHEVVWWTSRFDHFTKRFFDAPSGACAPTRGLSLRLLPALGYHSHVSARRLFDHLQVGVAFRRAARRERDPDVVLCSFPTIELSLAAVAHGRTRGIPVVLDVRDLWPDLFLDVAPAPLRGLARAALAPWFAAAQRALRGATALAAVSDAYLAWGLARAARTAGEADRVFPLGYELSAGGAGADERGAARLGIRPERVTCVFSGTFGRSYDLAPVFAVAGELDARGFDFLICGDGEQGERWREQAAGLRNVRFTGWLAREQLECALAASDVGLAAYAAGAPQGLPNKLIEYLAAGLPVVSSLAGETRALLAAEGCGLSYDAARPDTLRAALLQLADGAVRERCGAQAARVFAARFRAEAVYAAFADHLESIAARRASPAAA